MTVESSVQFNLNEAFNTDWEIKTSAAYAAKLAEITEKVRNNKLIILCRAPTC